MAFRKPGQGGAHRTLAGSGETLRGDPEAVAQLRQYGDLTYRATEALRGAAGQRLAAEVGSATFATAEPAPDLPVQNTANGPARLATTAVMAQDLADKAQAFLASDEAQIMAEQARESARKAYDHA